MSYIKKLGLAVLILGAFRVDAQSDYYGRLSYRFDDPFLFCTEGQDPKRNSMPCWKPVPPYTGAYMLMPYCRPPNYYGKEWTQDDHLSLAEYQRTCPHAMTSGAWDGEGGTPQTVPFDH